MKLAIELTPSQRAKLQSSAESLTKLIKKFASLEKQRAEFEETKIKATARLNAALAAEEKGDEEASAKVYALNRQIERLNMSLGRLEEEGEALEKEAASAAYHARTEIRAAHSPLRESIVAEVAEFLAPFCEHASHARSKAEELYAVTQIQLFTRRNMPPNAFRSSGTILSDIEAIGKTLAAMLAGDAVVKVATGGKEAGLVFPAYC